MSYQSGVTAFKEGNYQKAATELHQVVEEDDQNHKAWNALGVVLTKTGQYEDADSCYHNALTIAPDTPAYQRNRDKNKAKWKADEVIEVDDEPAPVKNPIKKPATQTPTQYTRAQQALGVVGILIFLIIMGGACVAIMGSGSSKAPAVQAVVTSAPVQAVAPVQVTAVQTAVTTTEPIVEQTSDRITAGEKNAAKKAKSYLEYSAFSRDGLIKQLEYEKFTPAEAEYGVDQSGADWNEQAAKKAKSYLDYSSFSRDGLIKQLLYEKFTPQQAEYGAKSAGY